MAPEDAHDPLRIRPTIEALEESEIVQVWQLGFSVPDVIGLWVGESDIPTPRFICDAAAKALTEGQTFYTHKRGIPALRQAIRDYQRMLHGVDLADERLAVTSAGMNAMMLIAETIMDPGDNIAIVTPVWPNLGAAMRVMGAEPRAVPMQATERGWHLDLDRLFDACDSRTRAIYVASPGNPTGWVITPEEQRAILAFCRKRGIWAIADEVYERLIYDAPAGVKAAPSFLAVAEPEDPLFVVNSFSKSWAMTGWRIGWLVAPAPAMEAIDRLIEFNTSGAQPFLQQACVTAIHDGEPFVQEMVERCRRGRDIVMQRLSAMPRVRVTRPEAAFYVMFQVDGVSDSLEFAKRLVHEARVGLAPGTAFGPGGEGFLRLCFASGADRLSQAMDRLEPLLS